MKKNKTKNIHRRRPNIRRRIAKVVLELIFGLLICLVILLLIFFAFMIDVPGTPSAPEHVGQIQYYGVWWDEENFEDMMKGRDEYLQAEQDQYDVTWCQED